MQYILSQEEYNVLLQRGESAIKISTEKLQQLCTEIADTLPIVSWKHDSKPEPWGCVITIQKQDQNNEWYCDKCPVQTICPLKYKSWSK
jgi:hypothetical protein